MPDLNEYKALFITAPRQLNVSIVDNVYQKCSLTIIARYHYVLVNDMPNLACPLRLRVIKSRHPDFKNSEIFRELKEQFPSADVRWYGIPDDVDENDGYALRDIMTITDASECIQFLLTYGTQSNA